MHDPDPTQAAIEKVVRQDRGRLMSVLISNIGDFQLAEDSLQDALASALVHWARHGQPRAPVAWLLQTARRKAIDRIRRQQRFDAMRGDIAYLEALDRDDAAHEARHDIPDERLRLIFTCCHPSLDEQTRVALTLRTLGGLATPEIARAFLVSDAAMSQRLVRARHKIAKAGIPYQVPEAEMLPSRLTSVLAVVYLIFNEGYAASTGQDPIRVDLCEEAVRLGWILRQLLPGEAEIEGLLALMLFSHARRDARQGPSGLVALDAQDRSLWDRTSIGQGQVLLETALRRHALGPYQIQAAISGVHCAASRAEETDWSEITLLYDQLVRIAPSPVVSLNRWVAASYVERADIALARIEALAAALGDYQPYHAARADLLARTGQYAAADRAYGQAIALSGSDLTRQFLTEKRLRIKKEAEQKLGPSPTGRMK